MNKIFAIAVVIAMFFSIDALVLTKNAEAGITCITDALGNYRCTDSYGNSSTTRRDALGNDRTTFGNGRTMTCRTDALGNYRCN